MTSPRSHNVRLGPGFWVDADGALHVSIPELLAELGEADTPENRERMLAAVEVQARELMPDADFRRADSCPHCGLEGLGAHRADCPYGAAG